MRKSVKKHDTDSKLSILQAWAFKIVDHLTSLINKDL